MHWQFAGTVVLRQGKQEGLKLKDTCSYLSTAPILPSLQTWNLGRRQEGIEEGRSWGARSYKAGSGLDPNEQPLDFQIAEFVAGCPAGS